MDKPKIYISSTFFDLEEHRTYLVHSLRNTECFDIISMESYGTRSQRPLDKCLYDVESSAFYILLLGKRYGYIPADKQYSITNLEYKAAIGDKDETVVAGEYQSQRHILPFIINDDYPLKDAIAQQIQEEEKKDGEALTNKKQDYLQQLKSRIKTDFVVESRGFTSPQDLAAQVLSALIHILVTDGKKSLVDKLRLSDDIVYRCDRERVRHDFILKNQVNKNFYKAFIIHGEDEELPVQFSNNISAYELQVRKNIMIRNFDDYVSDSPEKFIQALVLRIYRDIFPSNKEAVLFNLEELAARVIKSDLTSVVITIELNYQSWKSKYTPLLACFFDLLQTANGVFASLKSIYFMINIVYDSDKQEVTQKPSSAVLLEKLGNVNAAHIKDWLQTYFFQNTDSSTQNSSDALAEKILFKYFPECDKGDKRSGGFLGRLFKRSSRDDCFTMEETIKRLEQIVKDFNNNKDQNLFN
jgi:hypothetical protein